MLPTFWPFTEPIPPFLISNKKLRCRSRVPKGSSTLSLKLSRVDLINLYSSLKRHLDVMEILLTFAMEGIQELRDAPDMLLRAAAGGFTALTDKMADLNGSISKSSYFGPPPIYKTSNQEERLMLWTNADKLRYSRHVQGTAFQLRDYLSTNIMRMSTLPIGR